MSRPRLSDAHHALVGTAAHKSTARVESKLSAARPKMPAHLSKAAKAEWRRIVPMLLQRGSLTDADSTALSLYAETYARWLAAKADVEQHGLVITVAVLDKHGSAVTTRKTNPALRTLENCERSLRAFLREIGMTPATRERILPAQEQPEQTKSIFQMMKDKQK